MGDLIDRDTGAGYLTDRATGAGDLTDRDTGAGDLTDLDTGCPPSPPWLRHLPRILGRTTAPRRLRGQFHLVHLDRGLGRGGGTTPPARDSPMLRSHPRVSRAPGRGEDRVKEKDQNPTVELSAVSLAYGNRLFHFVCSLGSVGDPKPVIGSSTTRRHVAPKGTRGITLRKRTAQHPRGQFPSPTGWG